MIDRIFDSVVAEKTDGWHSAHYAFTINNTDLTKHVAAEAQIPLLINEISIELYQHKAVLHISSLFL